MRKEIFTTFDMPGIHHWPNAPDHLHFIRTPHRHDFHFQVGFAVDDSDRELEFFEVQSRCAGQMMNIYDYNEMVIDFGSDSCEMIAEKLLALLPEQAIYVEVSEDGENGARVWR